MPLDCKIEAFLLDILDAVYEEVEKLDEGQTLPISTEIVELYFWGL